MSRLGSFDPLPQRDLIPNRTLRRVLEHALLALAVLLAVAVLLRIAWGIAA